MVGRLAVAVAGSLLALVLGEGFLSLTTGRSLRELVTGARRATTIDDPLREWRAPNDDDRIAAANRSPGLYKVHEDPLVGYVMRAEAELSIGDGEIRTDSLGMRVRPGPELDGDPLRIVVLGDSVAFGHGVDDDQTLAHQLEQLLARELPGGSRQVLCRTVAAPGWNHRNAVHFLLDHFDRYEPDIVLYLPITNDLANTFGVYETGHRWDGLDLGSADPWLAASVDRNMAAGLAAARRIKAAGRPYVNFRNRLGPLALNADLSPESARRYDENARSIALLNEQLTRRGSRLMLLQWGQDAYYWHLLRRLADLDRQFPVVPLFGRMPVEFTLGDDPHSNPETLAVVARWCAEALVAEGWLEGLDALSAPAVPEAYEAVHAPTKGPEEWRRLSLSARGGMALQLQPEVNTETGQGLFQVYGGLNPDGSARRRLLLLLPAGDGLLRLSLAALPERDDLQPQSVSVFVDGVALGRLQLTSQGPARDELRWSAGDPGEHPVEVLLVAEREVLVEIDGRSAMACYRLLAAATSES